MDLKEFFAENKKAAIAMSGGVDSSYLLAAAISFGADVGAYFVKSAFQPEFEFRDAVEVANALGAKLKVINLEVLEIPNVSENLPSRCFYCKQAIFSAIIKAAKKDKYMLVLDGTNASDSEEDRPGMQALRELGVRSPLREAGLTKDEIRRLSARMGLKTAVKPAYACLATRIPTGMVITKELLHKVEMSENSLFELGYTDFRVRIFDGAARIQLPAAQMSDAILERDAIIEAVEPYFTDIFLDLKGR